MWSYVNHDSGPSDEPPRFTPARAPGVQLPDDVRTRANYQRYVTPMSLFQLFFTVDLVQRICGWTNDYAHLHGPSKATVYQGWTDIQPDEMYQYFALLMYMAVVKAPNINSYWSTAALFHGLWARLFMPRNRFKAIQSFLKTCDSATENYLIDKLCKVRFIHDYIKNKCIKLFQPYRFVSIDERMVRNKGRFTFRQFIKDKPTRWGMKLWVVADATNGYTYDFEVYVGKGVQVSKNGLAYDVVMRLCKYLEGQGYHVYFDNFYTGVQLVKDLLKKKIACCGTLQTCRKGVPPDFKDTKVFAKGPRGSMRWKREGNLLYLQWLDNKPVTFLSTIHKRANKYSHVKRRTKVNGQYRPLHVRQPAVVDNYNKHMGGVDKSDQLINKYMTLRKTHRYWKTLFYHFLDIARVNSFILFRDLQKKYPDIVELQRPKSYNQLDFTIELIKQMGHISENQAVPLSDRKPAPPPTAPAGHTLRPGHADTKRNCHLCYERYRLVRKTFVKCLSCGKHFCFLSKRNCLLAAHD